MSEIPSQYRKELNLKSKIKRVKGLHSYDKDNLPSNVITIEDLLSTRSSLSNQSVFKSKNAITHILKNNYKYKNIIGNDNIESKEDFILSLYSLLIFGDNVAYDGDKYESTEVWGKDIAGVLNSTTALVREDYFDVPQSLPKPQNKVKSVLFTKNKSGKDIYIFSTVNHSNEKEIKNISDEDIYVCVDAEYMDIISSALLIKKPELFIQQCRVSQNELFFIESPHVDLRGLIAPVTYKDIIDKIKYEKIDFTVLNTTN